MSVTQEDSKIDSISDLTEALSKSVIRSYMLTVI